MLLTNIYSLLRTIESHPSIDLTIHVLDERTNRKKDYYKIPVSKLNTLPPYVTIIPVIINPVFWQSCIYLQPDIPREVLIKTSQELLNICKGLTRDTIGSKI